MIISGLSIIIGVLAGFHFSEEKYFYSHPVKPKREITKETYEIRIENKNEAQYYTTQVDYNVNHAVVFGLASFGVLLIIGAFINKKLN